MKPLIDYILKRIKFLIKDGFFHIMTGSTLNKAISFISTIVIVRLVTKEEYGYLVFADNLYSYAALFSGLGMASGVLIFCSKEKNQQKRSAYFGFAVKYGTLVQLVASLIVMCIYLFGMSIFREAKIIVITLLFYPALSYVVLCVSSYIRAHIYNKLYVKFSLIHTVAVFVFCIILAVLMGVIGVPIARYAGITIAVLMVYKFLKQNVVSYDKNSLTGGEKKAFLTTSISLLIMNSFSSMMISNEALIVNMLIQDEVVTANYKVAVLIPSQLVFIVSSVTVYFFPKLVKMGRGMAVWNCSKKVGLATFVMVLIIILIAIPSTPIVIRVVFGEAYYDVTELLNMFWIVYAINAGFRMIPLNVIPAIGKEKFNAVLSVFSCIIHFIVDYYFVKAYGIYGVAFAGIIVYFISGMIAWIYLFNICKKEREKYDD